MSRDIPIPSEELVFASYDDAATVAKILLENEYVVMLSREENFYVINWVWSKHSDRNDVAFMGIDVLDTRYIEVVEDEQDRADVCDSD